MRAALIGVSVLVVAVLVWWGGSAFLTWRASSAAAVVSPPSSVESTASAVASLTAGTVEVPQLAGLALDEAKLVLQAAGLVVEIREAGTPVASAELQEIQSQEPSAGVLVQTGTAVALVVGRIDQRLNVARASTKVPKPERGWVVCLDPGHQAHEDSSPEPLGPGADATKPAVSGGTTGVWTRLPEYEIALQISMNLKERLEKRGIRVVMTRTTNDVNLTNAERAAVANKAHADLFVRIHGDGSPDSDVSGVSTLYPASNKWTKPFAANSRRAAERVQSAVTASTGAQNRGIHPRGDISGFNWSKRPCLLVECGFLSSPIEDRLLASPHYQDKIAEGIADGIVTHLETEAGR